MIQDEYKKDFFSQKFCWVLDGRTFWQPQNAKEYLIGMQKRTEQFAVGYLVLLKDEYFRLKEQKEQTNQLEELLKDSI